MFKKSTFFMRVIIILLGAVVLVPSILFFPQVAIMLRFALAGISTKGDFAFEVIYFLLYAAIYVALIPFCMALYQTLKLLGYIDEKETFSEKTVKALKVIRNCAIAILVIFIVGAMPIICYFAVYDGIPITIFFWSAFALIPLAIAIFASMLMNLIQEAIDIKSENDLTI